MHVSRTHKFVYIGIPRTGSKSMYQWLSMNYGAEHVGSHHSWEVPEEFSDYLVFTIVRNPYDRAVSGWFFDPAINYPTEMPQPKTFAESMQQHIEVKHEAGPEMNQKDYVARSGATLVLYFERLPQCLAALPFVEKTKVPPFPHRSAGGYRPDEGDFFDFFSEEDENLVWDYAHEDFEAFGYQRHDCGLPDDAPNVLEIQPGGLAVD